MHKIDKLVYKEMIPTAAIALVTLTFIAFSKEFQRFAQMLITSGTTVSAFVQIILSIIPNVLSVTLPIALLIGTISCFSRLSADSEIIALKSTGVSVLRLLQPVMLVTLAFMAVTYFLTIVAAPACNNHLRKLQFEITLSHLTAEIQPRVFNERFKNFIFYVQDIDRRNNNLWKGILITDQSENIRQKLYLAKFGRVFINQRLNFIQLHLEDGVIYNVSLDQPESDTVTYFGSLDIPLRDINMISAEAGSKKNVEKSMAELHAEIHSGVHPPGSNPMISLELEYYRRLAIPFACMIFGMIGLPLGISTRKGGRSSGFVLSLVVVLLYYLTFVYSWKAGVYYQLFPIRLGVWIANMIFGVLGIFMLWQANSERHPVDRIKEFPLVVKMFSFFRHLSGRLRSRRTARGVGQSSASRSGLTRKFAFTKVLDIFILKEFLKVTLLTVGGALILFTIFTLFEIIDEVFANNVPWIKVVEYFLFVWPMVLVLVLPLCILVSLLICFGLLEKTNQVMALKACGVSLYRLSAPIVVMVLLMAISVFLLQEFILPFTNQKQDNLYNEIKGRTDQTYYTPDITWIRGSDGKIYNYSYFDYDRNVFADLSVFRIDLARATLVDRYFAQVAQWDEPQKKWILQNGWKRGFDRDRPEFVKFDTLAHDFREAPGYFKKELKKSSKMSFLELSRYIDRLKRSGFDTLALEVDLYAKISYPLVSLIMLLIGIPFSFLMGKRGALFGMAVSILIGIMFWAIFNLFTAMGGAGIIPPLLSAWAPNLFFGFTGLYLVLNIRT